MKTKQKLTLNQMAIILCLSPISISRLLKSDKTFPQVIKIGRSIFVDADAFYVWLSNKAGKEVTPDDNLMLSKHVYDYYSKSSTWLWMQVRDGNIKKPFKINTLNYWVEREIVGEVEEVA